MFFSFFEKPYSYLIVWLLWLPLSPEDMRMYENENEITTLSEYFQNPIQNFVERGKIDATNRQPHDRSLSWLDTVTYINNGGVKLVFFGLSLPSLWNLKKTNVLIMFLPVGIEPKQLASDCEIKTANKKTMTARSMFLVIVSFVMWWTTI